MANLPGIGSTVASQLSVALQAANIPIAGVSVIDPLNKATWRIDYSPSATPTDITNGNAILTSFPASNIRLVDCTVIQKQLIAAIYATPSNVFLPLGLRFGLIGVSGLVTAPTISAGTNAPNYDNLVAAVLSPLNAQFDMINILFASPTKTKILTAFTGVYMNVRIAATATTYKLVAMPLGDYLDVS